MRARARRETEIDKRPENETEEKREARLVIAHRMAFVLVLVWWCCVRSKRISKSKSRRFGERREKSDDRRPQLTTKKEESFFIDVSCWKKTENLRFILSWTPPLYERGGGTFFGNKCYFWQHTIPQENKSPLLPLLLGKNTLLLLLLSLSLFWEKRACVVPPLLFEKIKARDVRFPKTALNTTAYIYKL